MRIDKSHQAIFAHGQLTEHPQADQWVLVAEGSLDLRYLFPESIKNQSEEDFLMVVKLKLISKTLIFRNILIQLRVGFSR